MDTDVGDLQNGLLNVQEAMRQTLHGQSETNEKKLSIVLQHHSYGTFTTTRPATLRSLSNQVCQIPPPYVCIPTSSVAHPSASATRLYLDVYDGCRYVDETSMTWICKRVREKQDREREREREGCLTLRQGLSV